MPRQRAASPVRGIPLLLALLLLFPLSTAGSGRTVSAHYVGGGDPTFGGQDDPLPECDRHLAGACFAVQPDDGNVTLTLRDRFAQHVCAHVTFIDPALPATAETSFCDSARLQVLHRFDFPDGRSIEVHMTLLRVKVEAVGPLGVPPTLGTITAAFEPDG